MNDGETCDKCGSSHHYGPCTIRKGLNLEDLRNKLFALETNICTLEGRHSEIIDKELMDDIYSSIEQIKEMISEKETE